MVRRRGNHAIPGTSAARPVGPGGPQHVRAKHGEGMMPKLARRLACSGAGAVMAALAIGAAGLAPAAAATGPVSAVPAAGTPQLATTTTPQQIRQPAACGGTHVAAGGPPPVRHRCTTLFPHNNFRLSRTATYTPPSR